MPDEVNPLLFQWCVKLKDYCADKKETVFATPKVLKLGMDKIVLEGFTPWSEDEINLGKK